MKNCFDILRFTPFPLTQLISLQIDSTERDQLLTNLSAAYIAVGNGSVASQKLREHGLHTYEQLFNAACAEIRNGNLVAAEQLLTHSISMCIFFHGSSLISYRGMS